MVPSKSSSSTGAVDDDDDDDAMALVLGVRRESNLKKKFKGVYFFL